MSEYQYYEFCNLGSPITSETRKEMYALSSRARVGTHGASYIYNYGSFRGDPKQLLLKHFDVFFYIANFGVIKLMFKYANNQIDHNELKKYNLEYVINIAQYSESTILEINVTNEEGFGWIDGDEYLPGLLPLYQEIKNDNYKFLDLVHAINKNTEDNNASELLINSNELTAAQIAFLNCIGLCNEKI